MYVKTVAAALIASLFSITAGAQGLPEAQCTLAQNHLCQRGQCALQSDGVTGTMTVGGDVVEFCAQRGSERQCAQFTAEILRSVPPLSVIARLTVRPGSARLFEGVYMLDLTASGSFVLAGLRGGMTMVATGPCQARP